MSPTAPILASSKGKICFEVDDVIAASEPLPTASARGQFERVLTTPLLAFSHDSSWQTIEGDLEIHPLALAVHAAFSEHRPLVLTPDMIWLTIAQGFAHHVNNCGEELRSSFVSHQGKDRLLVETLDLPTLPAEWATIIEQWTLQIRDRVGADVYRLLECNFSTTTPITRTASHVVMMDAFKQYFDYVVMCVCGIPKISLLGTVADWQSIYDRVRCLSQYNLDWWVDRLLPICQKFIDTAAGKPDRDFWQCIYKPKSVYATKYVTGWLADLFPYLRHGISKAPTVRNHLLDLNRCELPDLSVSKDPIVELYGIPSHGIALTDLPLGISQVGFKLDLTRSDGTNQILDLELVAGFIGVTQDSENGFLQPEIGWGVRETTDRFGRLLDRLQQEHQTQAALSDWSHVPSDGIPKELMQMLDRFDGAIISGNRDRSWQILPARLWNSYWQDYDELPAHLCSLTVCSFIELSDGRSIAFNFNFRSQTCWFLIGSKADEFATARLIATNPIEFFDRILANNDYYFDEPNFQIYSNPI